MLGVARDERAYDRDFAAETTLESIVIRAAEQRRPHATLCNWSSCARGSTAFRPALSHEVPLDHPCRSAVSRRIFRCSINPSEATAPSRATTSPITTNATAISCPAGKELRQRQKIYRLSRPFVDDNGMMRYRASKLACDGCALKPRCCPTRPPARSCALSTKALVIWRATSRVPTPMPPHGANERRSRCCSRI